MASELNVVLEDTQFANPRESFYPAPGDSSLAFNLTEPTATLSNTTFASASNADDFARATSDYAEQSSTTEDKPVGEQPIIPETVPPPAVSPHPYLLPATLASLLTLGIEADVWDKIMNDAEIHARKIIAGELPPAKVPTPSPPAESTSTSEEKSQPPRPNNCFMVFRLSALKSEALPSDALSRQPAISRALGIVWHALPDDRQQLFKEAADVLKEDHKRKYPDYVYQPERKADDKRSKRKREETDGEEGDEAKENKRPRGRPAVSVATKSYRRSKKGKEKASSIDRKNKAARTPLARRASPSAVAPSSALLSAPPQSSSPPPPSLSSSPAPPPPPPSRTSSAPLPPPPTVVPSSLSPTSLIARPPSVVPSTLPSLRAHAWNPIPWLADFGCGEASWLSNNPPATTLYYPAPVSRMLRPLPCLPIATAERRPAAVSTEPSMPIPEPSACLPNATTTIPEAFAPDLEPSLESLAPVPPPPVQYHDELLQPLFLDGPTDWDNPLPYSMFPFLD